MKRILSCFSIGFLLVTCTNPIDRNLDRIEGLMNDYPDSALVLIQSINPKTIKTKKNEPVMHC